jgi:peptidoglycan/LPS O-acetylase OafA/YrhL
MSDCSEAPRATKSAKAVSYSLDYRPDIDGLRAIAVLLVVAFHLHLPVRGGFIGVDVFFVISGYLIGSIILKQTSSGVFTFSSFYERRIRRIIPALLVALAGANILAYRFLLPNELLDFGRSLLSANFSVSNFYFWRHAGYFDSPATSKPLLHTWSLAVEEQFYIALPIILVLLRKFAPKRIGVGIVVLTLTSMLISIVGAYRYPNASFYLVPARAWELLLGTMMCMDAFPRIRARIARDIASLSGVLLILAASLLYKSTTPFPGLAAIPPCLGAALVIAAGRDGTSLVGRMLSISPSVFVGKISYSLYLWHWPIVVFSSFGMTLIRGLSRHQWQVVTFVECLIVATLSWRFVETPFRWRRNGGLSSRFVVQSAAVGFVAIAVLASADLISRGFPTRFSAEARQVASYLDSDSADDQNRRGKCFITDMDWPLATFAFDECLHSDANKPSFLVLGDSHAAHMWWGLHAEYPNANLLQATAVGCKPVLEQRPRQFAGCTRLMDYVLKDYLPRTHVDAVLLEAHWDEGDIPSLAATIEWLREKKIHVVLFGPMLQYDSPLPRLLAMAIRDNDPELPRAHQMKSLSQFDEAMAELAQSTWHIPYVSLIHLLCTEKGCTNYVAPGIPLLMDYGHLTKEGSLLLADRIRRGTLIP